MKPKSVKIGPFTYRIVFLPEYKIHPLLKNHGEQFLSYGDIDEWTLTIQIRDDIAIDQQKVTLLHEILHGCDNLFSHNGMDKDSAEEYISRISAALFDVLRSNRSVTNWLLGSER
jgi:hypothetical protein